MRPGLTATIRPAEPADVSALLRLINDAFLVERVFIDGDRTDAADVARRMRVGEFLAAFVGERMVACVYVEARGARGYFGMLAVDPSCQKAGHGRRLVAAAEDVCRARGCTVMDLQVVNLRTELPAYYRALGYEETGTAPFPEEDASKLKQPCHFVRMTKTLVREGSRG